MIHRMEGCKTSPLSSYLKALGIMKIIGEQVDKNAKFFWTNEIFYIESRCSEEHILDFVMNKYSPSPIMDPWNNGSIIYETGKELKKIEEIEQSGNIRFSEIIDNFRLIKKLLPKFKDKVDENNVTEVPNVSKKNSQIHVSQKKNSKSKVDKKKVPEMISILRSQATDRFVEWLDASILVSSEGKLFFPPLMGTGGNEGNLDYAKLFITCIWELMVSKKREAKKTLSLLRNSLLGTFTNDLEEHPFGKFDPSRAGGANQGNGVKTKNFKINTWDFVFLMEGALLWSNDIGRRENYGKGTVLSPFTVRPSYVGFNAPININPKNEKEIWVPIWSNNASLCEIKKFLVEGRVDIFGEPPRNGLEFAEAINSLGVDRGIVGFNRYPILIRRGEASIAVDAGYFNVKENKCVSLLNDVAKYINYLKGLNRIDTTSDSKVIAAIQRRLERDELELTLKGSRESVMKLMRDIGNSYEEIVSRLDEKTIGYFDPSYNEEWIEKAWDDSVEFFLALSIATIRAPGIHISEMICDVLRRKGKPGIEHKIKDLLLDIAKKNFSVRGSKGRIYGSINVPLGYVTEYLNGNFDWRKFKELLLALILIKFSNDNKLIEKLSRRQENSYGLFTYPVSRVFYAILLSTRVEKNSMDVRGGSKFNEKLLRLLEAGRISGAFSVAKRVLMSEGYFLLEFENNVPDSVEDGVKMASALIFPIRLRDIMEIDKILIDKRIVV